MSSRGCAQGPNGELLDASQIEWYHDPDDHLPMAPSSATESRAQDPIANVATEGTEMTVMQSSCQPSAATLNKFFSNVPPAEKTAGSRRSGHALRPSAKVADPNNVALKCKSSSNPGSHPCYRAHHAHHAVIDLDEEEPTKLEDDKTESVQSRSEDKSGTSLDTMYEHTKSLGDADQDVRGARFMQFCIVTNL